MHKKLLRETPSCVMWINSRPYALCNWRNFAIVLERKNSTGTAMKEIK